MKDRRLSRIVWRAAHAVGAASLFALAAMLFLSLPARAQPPRMEGLEARLATLPGPSRHMTMPGASGWQPFADEPRGADAAWSSDAVLPATSRRSAIWSEAGLSSREGLPIRVVLDTGATQ